MLAYMKYEIVLQQAKFFNLTSILIMLGSPFIQVSKTQTNEEDLLYACKNQEVLNYEEIMVTVWSAVLSIVR